MSVDKGKVAVLAPAEAKAAKEREREGEGEREKHVNTEIFIKVVSLPALFAKLLRLVATEHCTSKQTCA